MSVYVPTAPLPTDEFSASSAASSFDDFSKWSTTVGDYVSGNSNIRNYRLISAPSFRPNSLTRVFRSGSENPEAFVLLDAGSSATLPWDGYNNVYDVPGASVNFYLRNSVPAGKLIIHSSLNLWKAREASYFDPANNIHASNPAKFLFVLRGLVDGGVGYINGGVSADTRFQYSIVVGGSPNVGQFTRRGLNLVYTATNDSTVPAGLHRFKLQLTMAATKTTSGAPGDATLYNHFKGSGARTSITAIYK